MEILRCKWVPGSVDTLSNGKKAFMTLRVPKMFTFTWAWMCFQVCQSNSPQTQTPALLINAYKPATKNERNQGSIRNKNGQSFIKL